MKNTTPHVGTLGQNFSSQVKSETYLKHYLHSPVEGIWDPFAHLVCKFELDAVGFFKTKFTGE